MKIESVRIENFRSFKDETIKFDNYTCLVGSNGAGKSTVLNALNVFFRQNKDSKTDLSKLTKEDFHHKNTDDPVKITVTFTEISDSAKDELSDYVRQDKLIVSSVANFDSTTDCAVVKQFGNRLGFNEFRKFFEEEKSGAKVSDLKEIYSTFQKTYRDLPAPGGKTAMVDALRKYEANHSEGCILIPSEDQFYGVSKGVNKLASYIQWVFIAASKDAIEESEESKTSALGQLLGRTVRSKVNFSEKVSKLKKDAQEEYQRMLDVEQSALDSISTTLKEKLESWSHPGITAQILWKQDSEKSIKVEEPWAYIRIGERGFEGDLARFGHGLQRSYMLALLQELTTISDETIPTLIMGIEEPEIYQHPPQAKHLAEVLNDLSENDSQILICSHSPLFIPGNNFETIRVVREKDNPSTSYISQLSYENLSTKLELSGQKALKEEGMLAKLYPSLNPIINEMFFCNNLILTEGIEDVAYISTYLMLTGIIMDFRRYGCHIVPVGGKSSIIKPLAMAKLLSIPTFVICDADTDKEQIEDEDRRNSEVSKHKKDNRTILNLLEYPDLGEWPSTSITKPDLCMWKTNLTHAIENELGSNWKDYLDLAYAHYGNPGGLKKNPLAIARALKSGWEDGLKSNLLIKLTADIVAFAKSQKDLVKI
ncbi:ATP-dependent nuclease [Desulfitobacterium sp.]|uniref:ATP-dependent nuclease n=1 Tax=Desulfitobacterium sp. TaxID=49981 RepID=UPI002C5AD59A|nr:AAA family ATPase [Desulfitobacterium sp.]HVJ49636.1 AAA family ATPase [Desulfitobacterium sp.]